MDRVQGGSPVVRGRVSPNPKVSYHLMNQSIKQNVLRPYSAAERNGALMCSVVWMPLDDTILNGRSQTQRPRVLQFHSCEMSRMHTSTETTE